MPVNGGFSVYRQQVAVTLMNIQVIARFLIAAVFAGFLMSATAAPQKARVKADRTNVRLQPNSESEVLTNLRKDDLVEVLEEVNGLGADGKPRAWSKISLPARVALWVYGPLIDAKAKTVKSESVHLRTGPGKNYSELGELPRGTKVTVVRELDDWFQIEPPPGLTAYVASSLLVDGEASLVSASPSGSSPTTKLPTTKIPAAAILAAEHQTPTEVQLDEPKAIQTAASAPAVGLGHNRVFKPQVLAKAPIVPGTVAAGSPSNPVPTTNVIVPLAASPANPTNVPPPASVVVNSPAIQDVEPERPASAPLQAELPPISPPLSMQPTTILPTAPILVPGDPNVPREVIREGFVRRAWNIQAPGYFELRSISGEGLLNYLVTENTNIDLKFYLGRQVIIDGTEWRDRRWKTPLVKVTSIKLSL